MASHSIYRLTIPKFISQGLTFPLNTRIIYIAHLIFLLAYWIAISNLIGPSQNYLPNSYQCQTGPTILYLAPPLAVILLLYFFLVSKYSKVFLTGVIPANQAFYCFRDFACSVLISRTLFETNSLCLNISHSVSLFKYYFLSELFLDRYTWNRPFRLALPRHWGWLNEMSDQI